jgi:hypothetical protein
VFRSDVVVLGYNYKKIQATAYSLLDGERLF